jgi:site-specific DNA-methyltransferase (adenine-specific)
VDGLSVEFPDLQSRVEHILTKQIFGIGITELTSLLGRRSTYCSKNANSNHSVVKSFTQNAGNIWYERTEHSWAGTKCEYCGASFETFDRHIGLETHAYAFIHAKDIKKRVAEIFGEKMQFDVIIGNPPYQLQDASASASATPIYQKFIEQAINLEPKFLTMVTPSRWFAGGKGLDEFRSARLSDNHMKVIVDFIVDKDAFPKINVNGGVNYFLWSKDHNGPCTITTVEQGGVAGNPAVRSLGEFDVFIRRNMAVSILRKIKVKGEATFDRRVSSRKPFGLPTNFFGASERSAHRPVKLYSSGKITWVSRDELVQNKDWCERWKVLIPRASDGNENYPLPIWDQRGPFISGPSEACSETYLVAAIAESYEQAVMLRNYMRTKLFRFLVSLRKITQDNKSDVFSFVPDLSTDVDWSDDKLYLRYGISEEETIFIDSMIRTMEWRGE